MESQAYRKCIRLLHEIVKAGNIGVISKQCLEHFITRMIGADKRTIKKYSELMGKFGFLLPSRRGCYKMNLVRVQNVLGGFVQLQLDPTPESYPEKSEKELRLEVKG